MNNALNVQYVGFEAKLKIRVYKFLVKQGAEDAREFTLAISNDAFLAHRVRYQDAPDICAHRLQRDLAATDNQPLKTHSVISDVELEEYRVAHSPKSSRPGAMYKPFREPWDAR